MNISWSMKRNRRHKLSFRCAVSGFVATCDISLCRYHWLWSFLYRRNSRAASSNQNVRVNELNLVLSCAFRYDEFKTVTRKWTQSASLFHIYLACNFCWVAQAICTWQGNGGSYDRMTETLISDRGSLQRERCWIYRHRVRVAKDPEYKKYARLQKEKTW